MDASRRIMSIISLETIRLNAQAMNKVEAIRLAGELLVKAGHVEPAYVNGMLAREQTISTYIGRGIATPHGQLEDLARVRSTGVSVVQFPKGIIWDEGDELAHLVIGIAATVDGLTGVLHNLVELVQEPGDAERLATTTDPMEIIERLSRP